MLLGLIIVALIVIFLVEAVLTEVEQFGWATVCLIATVVAMHFLHIVDVLDFVKNHTSSAILYTLTYLVVGVVWSFVKWFSFLIGFRDAFREQKDLFLSFRKSVIEAPTLDQAQLDEEFVKAMDPYSRHEPLYDSNNKRIETPRFIPSASAYKGNDLWCKPKAVRNKSRIVAWMAFWPFSMVGTLVNDPIRRLFNFLFSSFKALYQKLSDRVFTSHPELK